MKINQINISRNDYKNTLGQLNNENNEIQGGNFSFTPTQGLMEYILPTRPVVKVNFREFKANDQIIHCIPIKGYFGVGIIQSSKVSITIIICASIVQ